MAWDVTMAHLEDDAPENELNRDLPPSEPPDAHPDASPKVCKDCSVSLKGHWRFKHKKGFYYCRSCFRKHVGLRKLRRRALLRAIAFLVVAALCMLILIVVLLVDDPRSLFFVKPGPPPR